MFTMERLQAAIRFSKFGGCLLVAGLLIWRMNTYRDPTSPANMLPCIMCSILALFIILTGMAMGWANGTDVTEADAEVE